MGGDRISRDRCIHDGCVRDGCFRDGCFRDGCNHNGRRGVALLQMLVVILLVSGVVIITGRMTAMILRDLHDTPARQSQMLTIRAAQQALRRDVWQASATVQLSRPHAVMIASTDGARITWIRWTVERDGSLLRTPGDGSMPARYPGIAEGLTFETTRDGLTLHWPNGQATTEVSFVSQLRLAQARTGGAP